MSFLPRLVPKPKAIVILGNLLRNIEWELQEERENFVRRLHGLIHDWDSPYPDLRQLFQPNQIDQLLEESVEHDGYGDDNYPGELIVKFVINCGYKDEPELDGDGKLLNHPTSLLNIMQKYREGGVSSMLINDLFLIYDRFDVNYENEHGISHFHAACIYGCVDIVEKFFESGQDSNCTGLVPPLHFALGGMPGTREIVAKTLLAHGADPNLAEKIMGNTILHRLSSGNEFPRSLDLTKTFFEICEEAKQPLQVDAQNLNGSTPFVSAMAHKQYEIAELLLRNGADPNHTNPAGCTLVHYYCSEEGHEESMKKLFEICDKVQRTFQIDVCQEDDFTALEVAVLNFFPNKVNLLLERGADLSNFIFPNFNCVSKEFAATRSKNLINFNLEAASKLMLVVEHLKRKGYELAESDALAIMQFFVKFRFFEKSEKIEEYMCRQGFTDAAKKMMINSSVSLYELIQLGPKQAAKRVTYSDYLEFSRSDEHKKMPNRRACDAYLCDKLASGFFMSLALEPFIELIHYRLPMECCEMILVDLSSKDLLNIYLTASGQKS